MFRKLQKNLQDKSSIAHFIQDAKDLKSFGTTAYDEYFEKNKLEIKRLLTSANDFKRLNDANHYAAQKLFSYNPGMLNRFVENQDDLVTLINTLYDTGLLNNNVKLSIPINIHLEPSARPENESKPDFAAIVTLGDILTRKLDFKSFIKLDRWIQRQFIDHHIDNIAPLFTSVDDIIEFTTQDKHLSRVNMKTLVVNQPAHMLSLFKSCEDFIKLALIEKEQFAANDSPCIAGILVDKYNDQLIPLFKSANDIIKLAHCKNYHLMQDFIENNSSIALKLFNGDLKLYQELKKVNPDACGKLVSARDVATRTVKLAEHNKRTEHNPKLFAEKKEKHHAHVNDDRVANNIMRK